MHAALLFILESQLQQDILQQQNTHQGTDSCAHTDQVHVTHDQSVENECESEIDSDEDIKEEEPEYDPDEEEDAEEEDICITNTERLVEQSKSTVLAFQTVHAFAKHVQ